MSTDVIRDRVTSALRTAWTRVRAQGLMTAELTGAVGVDIPKKPEWGDFSTTLAMTVAAAEKRPPREVAALLAEALLEGEDIFDRVEVMPPGFLNLTLKRELWLDVLRVIEQEGVAFGRSTIGGGQRVLMEFVSANPTGPLHVGHGRGAAVGHALANILAASGYVVSREYYINDAGRQMRLLGVSVYARYQQLFGKTAEVPEDGYRGSYIQEVAAIIREQVGDTLLALPQSEAEERCTDLAYTHLLGKIRTDLEDFGIRFDDWFSEAGLLKTGAVDQVIEDLRTRELMVEQEGALWFRSSVFGDDKDRVVRKQDGDFTYLASDLGYHRDKLLRGYDVLIDVWGADHHGYIPRMQALVQAYGHPKDRLRVVLVQMVNLLRGGLKVEMSKRAGEFITMREVIDEVGADSAKFFFLMRRSDTHLDFDLDLAKKQSSENPVYYVQYAHARVASLFRVAQERGIPVPRLDEVDLLLLTGPDELEIIRKVSAFPTIVQGSAQALEPHRLTYYLQELANLLHVYYYKHRVLPPRVEGESDLDELKPAQGILSEGEAPVHAFLCHEAVTPDQTAARLVLLRQVQTVIRNGLTLLGLSAPERM